MHASVRTTVATRSRQASNLRREKALLRSGPPTCSRMNWLSTIAHLPPATAASAAWANGGALNLALQENPSSRVSGPTGSV